MVLPIKQDVYSGFAKASGLLRPQEDSIIIEYQVKDEVLGTFNSDIKHLEIPLRYIDSVGVERKWFTWYIQFDLNQLSMIQKPLMLDENRLSFALKRNDVEKARSLKSNLMIRISEQNLRDLDDESVADDEVGSQHQGDEKTDSQKSSSRTRSGSPEEIEVKQRSGDQHSDPDSGTGGLKNMLRKNETE